MPETKDQWSGDEHYADEIELIELLRVLWRRRVLILGGTLLCGIAAFLVSSLMTPVYEADMTLLVTSPKFQANGGSALPTTIPNLTALVKNRGLVARMLDEIQIQDATPQGFIGGALTVEAIRDTTMFRVVVRLADPEKAAGAANRLGELAVEFNTQLNQSETAASRDFIKQQLDQAQVRRRELEEESLRFQRDAQIEALKIESESLLSQLSTLANERFTLQQGLDRQQTDEAAQRLNAAHTDVMEFGRTEQLPRTERLLVIKLDEKAKLEAARTDLATEIEALRARLGEAQVLIASQSRLLEETSSIRPPGATLRPEMLSPFLNPTFQVLEQDIVATQTRLVGEATRLVKVDEKLQDNGRELEVLQAQVAEKQGRQDELGRALDLATAEYLRLFSTAPDGYRASLTVTDGAQRKTLARFAEVQESLYERQIRLANLELEREITEEIYSSLATQYEQARIQVGSRSAQLQVIDTAFVPLDPVAPRKGTNTLLALVAGAMLFTILAFLSEYVRSAGAVAVVD